MAPITSASLTGKGRRGAGRAHGLHGRKARPEGREGRRGHAGEHGRIRPCTLDGRPKRYSTIVLLPASSAASLCFARLIERVQSTPPQMTNFYKTRGIFDEERIMRQVEPTAAAPIENPCCSCKLTRGANRAPSCRTSSARPCCSPCTSPSWSGAPPCSKCGLSHAKMARITSDCAFNQVRCPLFTGMPDAVITTIGDQTQAPPPPLRPPLFRSLACPPTSHLLCEHGRVLGATQRGASA